MSDDNKAAFDRFAVAMIENEFQGERILEMLEKLLTLRTDLPQGNIEKLINEAQADVNKVKAENAHWKEKAEIAMLNLSEVSQRALAAEALARAFANEREMLKDERTKVLAECERLRAILATTT